MEVTSVSHSNVKCTVEQENSHDGDSGGGCSSDSLLTAELVEAGMMSGHSKGTPGKNKAGTFENSGNEKMMAGAPKVSSMCNSHLVFATLQSQIIAARREPAVTAGKDVE